MNRKFCSIQIEKPHGLQDLAKSTLVLKSILILNSIKHMQLDCKAEWWTIRKILLHKPYSL